MAITAASRVLTSMGLDQFLGSIGWDDLLGNRTLTDMVNVFYEVVNVGIALYIPLKRINSCKFPRWFSPDLKNHVMLKKAAHKKYKDNPTRDNYLEFSAMRARCKILS